jgi:zinc transport system substrate-binding protein
MNGGSRVPRPNLRALSLLVAILAATLALPALGGPRVIASIAPLHSLVAGVMQDVASPGLLLKGSESPHTFSLRPSDARRLNEAEVLFWIGPTLEVPLARILPNLGLGRAVAMLEAPGVERLPVRGLHASGDHGHGHAAGSAQPAVQAADPHIWLAPANAIAMSDEIARVLAAVDPANAARYRDNATRQRARLNALDRELRGRLSGLPGRFAVFHDAYRYLEHAYGLQSVGTVTTHPERRPGAAHLRELRAEMADQGVRCLFSEPQFQPRLVRMLSEGLGIRHAILDPLGADIPPGPDVYPQLMRSLVDNLTGCMQAEAP